MEHVESQGWNSSNPAFRAAWTDKNKALITDVYREIASQWAERAKGATIADVYILCRELFYHVQDIENELDAPNLSAEDISNLCQALLRSWGIIFSELEKNSYGKGDSVSGIYVYKDPKHLMMNEWIRADGITSHELNDFISGKKNLSEVLQGESEGLQIYNIHIMNDGSVTKKITLKQKRKTKEAMSLTEIKSDNNLTADGEMQVPVLTVEQVMSGGIAKSSTPFDEVDEMASHSVGELEFVFDDEPEQTQSKTKDSELDLGEFETVD